AAAPEPAAGSKLAEAKTILVESKPAALDPTDQIKEARRRGVELQESVRAAYIKLVELQSRFGDAQEKKKDEKVTAEAIAAAKAEMGQLLQEIGIIVEEQGASVAQLAKSKDTLDGIRVSEDPLLAKTSRLHQAAVAELSERLKK